MKKIRLLLLSAIMLNCCCIYSQTNFWQSVQAYLGQKPPDEIPEIFAQGMLVDSGIVLSRVAFSKDGKEFYYTYAKHWFDDEGIGVKRIVFDGQHWKKPEIICTNLSNPTFSIDGKSLYFGGTGSTVWKAEKINDGWSKPVKYLDMPYGLYNFMPTESGNFYVGSNDDRSNKKDYSAYDFSLLTISEKDTAIKSLGAPLNTPGFDGDFYVAPDESYIIISTNETPTYECELYISFRKKDKAWTKPVSLGAEINTGLAHRFGQYVSPDGRYLFYTKGTSEKDCNFYWVKFDTLLEKLRKKSFKNE